MKTIIVLFVLFLLTGDLLASRPEIDLFYLYYFC